ncbi:MAG: SlyX family protein [Gammaproteobacteria bacterium]|jgi:SlyX protein|nr:MAG: SlyX family protein [Gammaproteobacteria bacterium]
MNEKRLEQIEIKLAYQDQAMQDLSDVVYRQEKALENLEARLGVMTERIGELLDTLPDASADEEIPPHY